MSTHGNLSFALSLLFFSVTIVLTGCSGGGSGASSSSSTAGFDGLYNCSGTSVTPAGSSSGTGSFTCSNGHCADSSGAFTGTVDANGLFSGTDTLCQTCLPLPMSGQFSKTSAFTLSGQSGNVSMTMTCNYGGSTGGGAGGGTLPAAVTGFNPTSGAPGAEVTVTGTNFPTPTPNLSNISVSVCGVQAAILSVTSTEIVFSVPYVAAASCDVLVTVSGVPITAGGAFTVTAFTLPSGSHVYWTEHTLYSGFVRMTGKNGGTITTINASPGIAMDIAVNDTGIYWIDGGIPDVRLKKSGLTGNTISTLASNLLNVFSIALDSSNVFWGNYETVNKVGIAGGTPSQIASGLAGAYNVALDSANVYWTEQSSSGSLKKMVKSGGTVTTLVSSGLYFPSYIAVDAVSVYFIDSGSIIKKVGINGGTVATLASGLDQPRDITVDSTSVYWTEYNSGTVKKIGLDGGAVTILASGLNGPDGIAVDSTSVYWAEEGSGTIKKMALSGGAAETIASGLFAPSRIAVYPQ